MVEILIGCDPELFLKNPNSGAFQSGHIFPLGSKRNPQAVPFGAVQNDGTAVEFNIDPARHVEEFVGNIKAVREKLQSMTPGYTQAIEPVARFTAEDFIAIPDQFKELGCDPDYNAWTGDANPQPDNTTTMRTASGHVHIGWGDGFDVKSAEHFSKCCAMGRQMDYYLGIYSLLWDPDPTRRAMYGQAGAFRPKPYGMEYRVMSNRWLASEQLIRWVYNSAVRGAHHFLNEEQEATNFFDAAAMEIINNNETDWMVKYPDLRLPVPVPPGQNKVAA